MVSSVHSICTPSNTDTDQRGWLPGPPGLPAPMGKPCPYTGEFLTTGEQRDAGQGSAPPTAGPRPPLEQLHLCSPWKASLWIANTLIHRNSRRGWGRGWGGVAVGCPSSSRPSPSPLSGDSILRHAAVCLYHTHDTHWTQLAAQRAGRWLVAEQGEAGLFTESAQPLGRGGTGARPP